MICVDFEKQRMTLGEAKRAYGEMARGLDPQHAQEVREMLRRADEEARENQKAQAGAGGSKIIIP